MEISRILTLCIVFLIAWQETLNQEIPPEAHLDKRNKRYHKSDRNGILTRLANDQITNGRVKKNVRALIPTNIGPQVQIRPLNLNLGNKNSARTVIPRRKVFKLQPHNTNNKNVFLAKKHDLVDKRSNEHIEQNKTIKTLTNESSVEEKLVEKEHIVNKVVDTKEVEKTPTDFPANYLVQNPVKLFEEADNIKPEKSKTVKIKFNSESKKKSHKTNKISEESDTSTGSKRPKVKLESKYSKKDIPVTKPITEADASLDQEIKIDVDSQNEEKVFVDVSSKNVNSNTNDDNSNSTGEIQVDKVQPNKHPFLEVIQNDLNRTCSPLDKPDVIMAEVIDPRNGDNVLTIQNPREKQAAFDLDSTHKQSQGSNDEIEGATINNKNYEEVIEIYHPPQVPVSPQFENVQDPLPYDSNYQVPYYDNNRVPNAVNDFINNNQYDNSNIDQYNNPPNDQKIEQIDGVTVVSYNNYYKTPTAHDNWNNNRNTNNYPIVNTNNNINYDYQAPAYQRMDNNNLCNNNRGFENQATRDVKERIWRSWKNTELNIKSKNAMKLLANEKLYDLANQNNNADKMKFIQRRAIGLDGCYRNQNISPYL